MRTVMIVEDEMLEQDFLRTIVSDELDPEDIIVTCESGLMALELAELHKPDIILMDLFITEQDGLTTIESLRNIVPDACISILSACCDFTYAQRAIKLRVFEYLLKPVKPRDVKDLFKRMLAFHDEQSEQKALIAMKTTTGKEQKVEKTDGTRHEGRGERQFFINEAVKYIEVHYRERLTLEMVASKVFVNPKYFSHMFKKELGVAFTDYIIKLRIKYACELLETTNHPAYRISYECGFSDPSYFNRVFCAQMDMTPQTYRKLALTNATQKPVVKLPKAQHGS